MDVNFASDEAGDRFAASYTLSLSVGLRMGEALGLRWSDIVVDAKTLRVSRQLQRMREGGGLLNVLPLRGSVNNELFAAAARTRINRGGSPWLLGNSITPSYSRGTGGNLPLQVRTCPSTSPTQLQPSHRKRCRRRRIAPLLRG